MSSMEEATSGVTSIHLRSSTALMMCMWFSTNPGVNARPARFTTRVSLPTNASTDSLEPTRTMRLPATATASATSSDWFTVITRPLTNAKSASRHALLAMSLLLRTGPW